MKRLKRRKKRTSRSSLRFISPEDVNKTIRAGGKDIKSIIGNDRFKKEITLSSCRYIYINTWNFQIYWGEVKPYSLKAFKAKYLIIRCSYFSVETLQDQNGPSSVVRNFMFACIKNIHQLVHGHMWIYESLHISCDNEIKLAWHLDIRGLLKRK